MTWYTSTEHMSQTWAALRKEWLVLGIVTSKTHAIQWQRVFTSSRREHGNINTYSPKEWRQVELATKYARPKRYLQALFENIVVLGMLTQKSCEVPRHSRFTNKRLLCASNVRSISPTAFGDFLLSWCCCSAWARTKYATLGECPNEIDCTR